MSDGGGSRATLELLLHFHGFKNIDLRSRGVFCVETVAYPVSSPGTPGVPFRTFCDASARHSAARGVTVHPVEGDADEGSTSGTSKAGLPSFKTSLLPIRFTNEKVQFNEGCLFRIHVDADWLETDVVAIEFRLMSRHLPDTDAPTECEAPSSGQDKGSDSLKEVGKMTLHAKCASAKGGLHRYHPLVFPQPHLCLLDVTLHMALTAISHPGGPAGLAAAIAANAFPSEDSGGAPAPRGMGSPARQQSTPTRNRMRGRSPKAGGRLSIGGERAASPFTATPPRPRFTTPGRTRKSAFFARGRSASFSNGGSSLTCSSPIARPHRIPFSKSVLEAAESAVGLATALGYAPAPPMTPDKDKAGSTREVYRAAELLYSRHALGLRWSKGTLLVARTTAMTLAAEIAVAAEAAAKRRSRMRGKKGKGVVAAALAADADAGGGVGGGSEGGADAGEGGMRAKQSKVARALTVTELDSPTRSANGDFEAGASKEPSAADAGGDGGGREATKIWDGEGGGDENELQQAREARVSGDEPAVAGGVGGQDCERSPTVTPTETVTAPVTMVKKGPGRMTPPPDYKELVQVPDGDSATEVPSDATPKSDTDDTLTAFNTTATSEQGDATKASPPTPPPPPLPLQVSPSAPPRASAGVRSFERARGVEKVRAARDARSRSVAAAGGKGGRDRGQDPHAWTWGASAGKGKVDTSQIPLPSDVRQLSRVIHARLAETSTECCKAWAEFARATFECGREGLLLLREEWVRSTTRAWSGQCLENVMVERAELLRLNESLLEPEGFLPLRARAGIRLKRRASPTGGNNRYSSNSSKNNNNSSGSNSRRRRMGSGRNPSGRVTSTNVGAGNRSSRGSRTSGGDRQLSDGMARLNAFDVTLSSASTIPDITAKGRRGKASSIAVTAVEGVRAQGNRGREKVGDKTTLDEDIDDDDDDRPPLLDVLVRRKDYCPRDQGPSSAIAGGAGGATMFTPRQQGGATWGAVSPWGVGPSQRPDQGWLSRLATGAGGGLSSPTNSARGAVGGAFHARSSSAGAITEAELGAAGGGVVPGTGGLSPPPPGMVVHFPPPPQSLLPVYDRELHGFDSSAPEDNRWGELPFLVVESWGGVEEAAPPAPGPSSPMVGTHEYRLFQEIAANSTWQGSPTKQMAPLLLGGKTRSEGSGSTAASEQVANGFVSPFSDEDFGGEAASVKSAKSIRQRPPIIVAANAAATAAAAPGVLGARSKALSPTSLDLDSPPPPAYVDPSRPSSAYARSRGLGAFAVSPTGSALSNVGSTLSTGTSKLGGSPTPSNKSIWDHPPSTRQRRGPKYYAERRPRPTRVASLPPSGASVDGDLNGGSLHRRSSGGSGSFSGGIRGGGMGDGGDGGGYSSSSTGYSSSDDAWSGVRDGRLSRRSSSSRRRSNSNSSNNNYGRKNSKGNDEAAKKRTKRAEIQRRMWGRRPSWTTALLAPGASATVSPGRASGGKGSWSTGGRTGGGGASAPPKKESGVNHLIVLVHGLGGRPGDMALMRGYLQTLMPAAELMVATSLQDMRKDNLGVEAMGHRLAEEVHTHITRFCPYFGSTVAAAPSTAPSTANAGSLPLSPVTPMRPSRGGSVHASPARGSSPVTKTRGVHASPGAAAAARAVSSDLGGAAQALMTTPSRSSRRKGVGRSSSGNSGRNGVTESTGLLSFVCFSMGGLVARSALLESAMVPYLTSLHCFVTLACPHLGQTSTPLSFFKTGAWAVRKLTGLRVLHELDLDDADDPRETTLYRLSLSPGLERFRTIVFAANPRDGFVPLHSASVRAPPKAASNTSPTDVASAEMAEMLMSKVNERDNRVVRMTLDAPRSRQAQGALDSVIGRAGHMCFIDSAQVAWLISLALLPFLEESKERR